MTQASIDSAEPMTVSLTERLATSFNRAAKHYNNIAHVQQSIAEHALSMVPQSSLGRALDIGCGTGRHTAQLAQMGYQATGIDIAPNMVKTATEAFSGIDFKVASAEHIPLPEGAVSLCFSSMALQWSESEQRVMDEIYRVLAPGGIAVLAIMVEPSFRNLDRAQQQIGFRPTRNVFRSHMEWLNWGIRAGFTSVKNEQKPYIDKHDSILALLRSISNVGAGVRATTSYQTRMTRKDITSLGQVMRELSASEQLEIDYQISHFLLQK